MPDEPLVIFTPSGRRGRVPRGISVLDAAHRLGVDLNTICGGRGVCSKCQVSPAFGQFPKHGVEVRETALTPRNSVEDRYDSIRGLRADRRLGCQACVLDDVLIDVPPESQLHRQVIRKEADARPITIDAAISLHYVEVREPDMAHPSGDMDRLREALSEQWGIESVEASLQQLAALQTALRKGKWTVTCAIHRGGPEAAPCLVRVWPGFHDGPVYGLAVDIGSTTVAGHLSNLMTGEVVSSLGVMNPQIRFGEDLMSRVSYAMMNSDGAARLTAAIRQAVGELSEDIARAADVASDQVLQYVFVGNPVMHHLFLGIDPVELGQAPFALATAASLEGRMAELGLAAYPDARFYILPCIAGHVGADAAAVALAEAPHRSDDIVLVVDVGTNAELLLGNRSRILACSSPTGPAFEGAQISSGQRAAPGAIERVRIDPVTKEPRVQVIGCALWSDAPGFEDAVREIGVSGICGSGIIEAIAEMRMAGLVDAAGLIGSSGQTGSMRCVPEGRTHAYVLHDWSDRGGARIAITQNDVRAVQLAKSALYAGARLLMDRFGIERPDRVALAGAFGAHISPRHAMVLGMIPDCPLDKVVSVGNAAGDGARMALLNVSARREIEALARRIEKIETATEPRFQEHFVAANAIPHATDLFANLAGEVDLPDLMFNPASGRGTGQRRRRRPA
jgi:uncharacterized 2Fe-2S/4Fe-4S cluster protein (DUF4445 family)